MHVKTFALFLVVVGCILIEEITAVPEQCEQPLEVGPCKAMMFRYGYDHDHGKCIQFTYGGCKGNSNNFKSLEECQDVCF